MNITELFKSKNLKLTNQRKIVLDLIVVLKDCATAKNIASKCTKDVDNSTVYRIIDLLLDRGILEKNLNYNNEIYYSLKEEHGHYFTCVKCHKKEKLDDCPLEGVEKELEDKKGYKILNHTVQIEGICKDCQND